LGTPSPTRRSSRKMWGGLTAAPTLKARNPGDVNIGFQMPFYPMIDDLQNAQSATENKKEWDTQPFFALANSLVVVAITLQYECKKCKRRPDIKQNL